MRRPEHDAQSGDGADSSASCSRGVQGSTELRLAVARICGDVSVFDLVVDDAGVMPDS